MDRLPPNAWLVDFEFSGTSEGERPVPICCVAREWNSGQTFRLWEDELATCPYGCGPDDVLIAYAAAAEIGCHIALSWPIPKNVLDLYAEFRCFTNTAPIKGDKPPPSGLTDALEYFGLPVEIDKLAKKRLQERCSRGGPWEEGEREEILAYCETDIAPLPALLEKLLPHLDLVQATARGRFSKAVAHMETTGIPIDIPKHDEVIGKRRLILAKLIEPVDKTFQVYTGTTLKLDRFGACLEREGISDWPRTPSGRPVLKEKALDQVLAKYPQMRPLFDLKAQISKLRKCSLKIGRDGFARTGLLPFTAATGRNARALGQGIYFCFAGVDAVLDRSAGRFCDRHARLERAGDRDRCQQVRRQEFARRLRERRFASSGRAAIRAYSRDRRRGRDPCGRAGDGQAGDVRHELRGRREDARAIGQNLIGQARKLRIAHRRTFPDFWRWITGVQERAYREGRIETGFGWQMRVPGTTRATTLMDWPMQSIGNEMMRAAACEAVEAGITLCCTVHDAFILMAPESEIGARVEQMRAIMDATSIKMLGFKCGAPATIFKHGEKFVDKKGAKMLAVVERSLAELEGIEPPEPSKAKRKPRAMVRGDGQTLHPYVAKVIENAEARIKTDEDPARALFIGANEAVKRANGHCIPDIDVVLARMQGIAISEGYHSTKRKKSFARRGAMRRLPAYLQNCRALRKRIWSR